MINLSKEKEISAVKLSLEKLDRLIRLDNIDTNKKMRVIFVIDKSYSMYDAGFYTDGTIRKLLRRILPIGIRIDGDESIEIVLFDDGIEVYPNMTMFNFFEYYGKHMESLNYGGTDYSKPLELAGRSATDNEQVLCIMLTDGDTGRREVVERVIRRSSYQNVFVKVLALGDANFDFLKKIKVMGDRYVNNIKVEYINSVDEDSLSDEELYTKVFSGLGIWREDYKKPNSIPSDVKWEYDGTYWLKNRDNHVVKEDTAVTEVRKGFGRFVRKLFGG